MSLSSSDNQMAAVKFAPKKQIGLASAAAISISLMIGSGIFSTPSSVVNLVGSPLMALIMYIIGGFFSLGGTFSFIELGIMFPKNGGTLRYLAHAFSRPRALLSYLFAWSMVICIRPGAIAANGPVFAQYWVYGIYDGSTIQENHPNLYKHAEWTYRVIALIGIAVATVLCMLSVKWSLRAINFFTIMKILVLTFFSVTGLLVLFGAIKIEKTDNWSRGFRGTHSDVGGYARALNRVFYAYDGWSNITYNVGEMINPARNLPIASSIAIFSVTVLYVLAVVAFFSVVPYDVALSSDQILAAEFTNRVFGRVFGARILPILIGCSVFGAVLAQIFAIGRIVSSAAEVGFVPKGRVLASYNKRFNTPLYALAFNFIITIIYLLAPPPGNVFGLLVDFVQYPTWFFYGLSALGCIYLRKKFPYYPTRSFKSFTPLTIIFILVCIYLSIFPFIKFSDKVDGYPYYLSPTLGICTIVIGLVPYYFRMYWWADKTGNDYTAWIRQEEEEQGVENNHVV
ncbi:hypothetical protein BB560_003977 [Smittium megazygosporum]|uniref:Amino acid permease/ SLC12A domain-containing protein n=1 Tax=Smittium megazygosporum TaxID=133381 RepID=A0A2T9ZAF9_9FUNG|nr:hypothetical protein BB560_003977 [Smittium megazygosporum]